MISETLNWIDIDDELPDDDLCVLVACRVREDESFDVFEAYKDSGKGGWSTPDGHAAQHVRYWAEMPQGPKHENPA